MKMKQFLQVQLAYYSIEMDTVDLSLVWNQCLLEKKHKKATKVHEAWSKTWEVKHPLLKWSAQLRKKYKIPSMC